MRTTDETPPWVGSLLTVRQGADALMAALGHLTEELPASAIMATTEGHAALQRLQEVAGELGAAVSALEEDMDSAEMVRTEVRYRGLPFPSEDLDTVLDLAVIGGTTSPFHVASLRTETWRVLHHRGLPA